MAKVTVADFARAKAEGRKLTMLTCYDYSIAKLMSACSIDAVLVGDSLGSVMLGYPDTLSVTMEDMISHTAAVSRGIGDKLVVADLPFMSYHPSQRDALLNAGALLSRGRAGAVKLEGGAEVAPTVSALVRAGVPVMGHIGLRPQSVNALGGYRVQGRDEAAARQLLSDAHVLAEAGAFALVLECVPAELSALVTERSPIPTIGIGAGPRCDGQILIWQDMAGVFSDYRPRFVRHFAEAGQTLREAFDSYAAEVRGGGFPGPEHGFAIDPAIIDKLR